jgi:hypothetical protein
MQNLLTNGQIQATLRAGEPLQVAVLLQVCTSCASIHALHVCVCVCFALISCACMCVRMCGIDIMRLYVCADVWH